MIETNYVIVSLAGPLPLSAASQQPRNSDTFIEENYEKKEEVIIACMDIIISE